MRNLERLGDALALLLLRIQSGSTLLESLRGLPSLSAPKSISVEWVQLREQIFAGEIPAEASIENFAKKIRLEQRLRALLNDKCLMPKFQCYLIWALSLIFFLVAHVIFPPQLKPGLVESTASLCLMGLSALWIYRLKRSFENSLWFSDWLLLLSRLKTQLSWGHTLAATLKDSLDANIMRRFPPALSEGLLNLKHCALQGISAETSLNSPKDPALGLALESLELIKKTYTEGRPMGGLLDTLVENATTSFERRLSQEAQRLSLWLLAPLFLLNLPAFLILLFSPLLELLFSGV